MDTLQKTLYYQTQNTLIAHASFSPPKDIKKPHLHALQRQKVRELLAHYQKNELFLEASFPYRLIGQQTRFVSFSHSGNEVALIIAPNACGIDIETRLISADTAKRFFHPNEIDYIASVASNEQITVRRLFWQIKESMVKLKGGTLSQLISQDMTQYVHTLIKNEARQWVWCKSSADDVCYLLWRDHKTLAIQAKPNGQMCSHDNKW